MRGNPHSSPKSATLGSPSKVTVSIPPAFLQFGHDRFPKPASLDTILGKTEGQMIQFRSERTADDFDHAVPTHHPI